MSKRAGPSALEAAIARAAEALHQKRAREFHAARLPYRDEDLMNANVTTFPQTSLGGAAQAVVSKLSASTKIENGQIIDKPGVYSMSLEWYHSSSCIGPSISSSGLRAIENESPLHYWANSPLNPDRPEQDQKPAFALGSAAHHLLLGEPGFREKFVIRPSEFPDWRTKASQQWRAEQIAAGKTVLDEKNVEQIRGMAKTLGEHPLVKSGLLNGAIEQSIIWQDSETGIWLKARPDALPLDGNIVVDLKTCASADPRSVRNSIADYGYGMQLALVGMGMQAVLGRSPGNEDYALIFVETKAPYAVNFKPIDCRIIEYGRMQIRRALRKFAECLSKGEWPGYDDDGVTVSLPKWQAERFEEQIKCGMLRAEDAA